MNSTSCGSRLVSSAARSPARSSTGPEVCRRLTPSSCAMMCDSVVLPRPGGPNSSTWSSASLRFFAASMKIESWSRIFSWPTYSSRPRGRSARSSTSSCGLTGAAAIRRSVSIMRLLCLQCRGLRPGRKPSSRLGQQLQRLPDAVADGEAFGQLLDRGDRFLVAVAQRQQRVQDVARRGARRDARRPRSSGRRRACP